MAVSDTLATTGVAVFGESMPVLAPEWCQGTPTASADGMTLTSTTAWLAPLGGFTRTPDQIARTQGVLLRGARGQAIASTASVISLLPQQYLRLARLYATLLESATSARPGRALGQPARPVPAYVVLGAGGVPSGAVEPGESLVSGSLSFHDAAGQPIDAVAVASAFWAIQSVHQPLQKRSPSDSFNASAPLSAMVTALASTASVRVRLVNGQGGPFDGSHLTGLTTIDSAGGVFTVADVSAVIAKAAASASFPAENARTRLVGLATTGRLADSVSFPALPTGRVLRRDFFTVRVLDLGPHLLGTPSTLWAGTRIEPRPAIRRDETVSLLTDGNDILGAAAAALTGAAAASLAVAQAIDGSFAAPPSPGTAAHWPAFPAPPATVAPAGSIPAEPRPTASAARLDDGNSATTDIDVVLTVSGLPAGAAVRAYNRVFSSGADETRGNGAGGIANASGTVVLRLADPLGLRRPGQTTPDSMPSHAVVHVDLAVVKRTGESRVFGDVSVVITGTAPPPPTGTNPFATATRRGICSAGILGLGASTLPPATLNNVGMALTLLSDPTPREAPRLPGMARRDLLVAGLASATGGSWQAVLAAGRLSPELHSAQARLGCPGGAGGRETQAVGVATTGGRLAFDIARAALRRTTSIYDRLPILEVSAWNEPPASTSGSLAGAVLQTVASACETPELHLLRTLSIVDPDDATFPRTFDALVDRVQTWANQLITQLPSGLPSFVTTKLHELANKMQELKDNAPADESTKERLFNELLREVAASGWGRRDAQWALHGAFARAERFIYIETPGISATAHSTDPFAVDLFAALSARMTANPALHVAICCPSAPDYPFGFNPFSDFEQQSRHTKILDLPTAMDPDPTASRVVAFHPVGFPGRPSRLESTVVVVDDTWALIGSSTLRRRGLTFDGGSDLVVTDANLVEGRSPAISTFRRSLQAQRLGIPAPSAPPALPRTSFVRLSDGVQAFHEIREILRAGGLGVIAPLTPALPVGRPASPGTPNVVNPDGESIDLVQLLVTLAAAGLASA